MTKPGIVFSKALLSSLSREAFRVLYSELFTLPYSVFHDLFVMVNLPLNSRGLVNGWLAFASGSCVGDADDAAAC